jgi:hypothetical protein
MAFFSWLKSKSGNPGRDDPEKHPAEKPAAESIPLRQNVQRFRETVPQSARAVSGSSTFKRPVRATIDIPLQTIWQSLPKGLAQENPSLDPKRRIQIPRKEVQVNDTDHTGTVSLFVLHTVCPDIFVTPLPSLYNRSVKFPLPAWERLRNIEVLEVEAAPTPLPEQEEAEPGRPTVEQPDLPVQSKEQTDQRQTGEGENLSDNRQEPSTINGATQPPETHSDRTEGSQSIRIALSPILRDLPFEFNHTDFHNAVGPNFEIELPLELIQPQLANGKVTVPLSVFLETLPETLRNAFGGVDQSTQVPIPLKEIFRHLPGDALPLRADQKVDEVREPIDTPFTSSAREDAKRFRNIPGSVERSEKEADRQEVGDSVRSEKIGALSDTPEPETPTVAAKTEPDFSSLQTVFLTDEPLNLPTIIGKISALPGLQTALLHTADGRQLSGTIGDQQFERAALTLFPAVFGEVKTKLDERECTGLETLTFCWRQEQISIFSDGRLCLSVRHSRRPFKPGVREKLALIFSRLAEALSSSEI